MLNHSLPQLTGLIAGLALAPAALAAEPDPFDSAPSAPVESRESREQAWVEFGVSLVSDVDSQLDLVTSTGSHRQDLSLEWSPGFAVFGGFHEDMLPWLAAQVQGGFLFNTLDQALTASGSTGFADVSLMQAPVMFNLVVQGPRQWRVIPFAGAGAGATFSWLDADDLIHAGDGSSVAVEGSSTEVSFAYQAFAGLRIRMGSAGSMGLTYRLQGAGDPGWTLEEGGTGASVGTLKVRDLVVQSVALSFQMRF